MGFFNHDDENDRQAYEQVQQGNEAHFSRSTPLASWSIHPATARDQA